MDYDNAKIEKIANEIINDAFWLGYVLEIKKNISDYKKKEVLSSFLIFFSSIFVEEIMKAKLGRLSGKRNITLKQIEDFRNYNLKYCPSTNSCDTKKTINEMGINLENYVFDIVLSLNNNQLIDINFRNWDYDKKENFELIDGLVATPLKWVEILMPDIYDKIKEKLSDISSMHLKRILKRNIIKKSYSSFKLFENSKINNIDKLYILQRYGLIKTTLFVDELLKERISFNIGNFEFDSKRFMIKTKAIIIEMLWNDKCSNSSIKILEEIFKENAKEIDDKFYTINRKCRNNLHYCDYHNITKKENDILVKYQDIYINNIMTIFDKNIEYKFTISYHIWLFLVRLDHWAKTQNI